MPAGAESVTLPPSQNVVGPLAVTVASGALWTSTMTGSVVDEQPFAFVIVTL
jgi:hypothetical protein